MLSSIAAAAIVVVHLAFVLFAATGGILALRWPRVAFLHLPAVAWAAYVELAGRICPLTPLENRLRAGGGLDGYTGDFVAEYLFPILYQEGLTREAQMVLGVSLIAANAAIYVWIGRHRRSRPPRASCAARSGRTERKPAANHRSGLSHD